MKSKRFLAFISACFLLLPIITSGQKRLSLKAAINVSYSKTVPIVTNFSEYKNKPQIFITPQFTVEYRLNENGAIGIGYWHQKIGSKFGWYPKTNNGVHVHGISAKRRDIASLPFYYKHKISSSGNKELSMFLGGQFISTVFNDYSMNVDYYADSLTNEYHYDSTVSTIPFVNTIGIYAGVNYQFSRVMYTTLSISSAIRPLMIQQSFYSKIPNEYNKQNVYTDFGSRVNIGIGVNIGELLKPRI